MSAISPVIPPVGSGAKDLDVGSSPGGGQLALHPDLMGAMSPRSPAMTPGRRSSMSSPKRSRQNSFSVPAHPAKAASTWGLVFKEEIFEEWIGRILLACAMTAAYVEFRKFKKSGRRLSEMKTVGCLLENFCVLFLASVRSMLPDQERVNYKESWSTTARKLFRNSILTITGGLLVEYGSVVLLHLCSTRVYGHVPYFKRLIRNPSPLSLRSLWEWSKGNAVAQVGGNTFQVLVESALTDHEYETIATTPNQGLAQFLRNFAILRVCNDVFFYLDHRIMHVNPTIYRWVHKRHHSHMTTNLPTNFMFTPLDVLGEAAVPIGVGLTVINKVFKIDLGRFESNVLVAYHSWFDAGTHTGKDVPLISFFAPLSMIYHQIWPWIDDKAIYFHELHHNKIMCNYGITWWIDHLMGSAVFDRSVDISSKF